MKHRCDRPGCDREFDSQRGLTIHQTNGHDNGERPWQDRDVLQRLYHEEGLDQTEMAERLGTSQAAISRQMRTLGVERRSRSERQRVERTAFATDKRGYELAIAFADGRPYHVGIHRLVAVAEYGFEAVRDAVVHHGAGPEGSTTPWDNRPENLAPMSPTEHSLLHHKDDKLKRDETGRIVGRLSGDDCTAGGEA